jgi:hypothetical protein
MKRKKEQYPKELRKGIPSHILLDFRALKLNIKVMTKMTDCGFNGQSSFSKKEYEEFTDKDKLQKFKDWYQKILTEYGV